MDWSRFIPPADLLEKAQGVERGLRQYQRLGRFGWLLGAAPVVLWLTLNLVPPLGRVVPSLNRVVLAVVVVAVVGAVVACVFIRLRLQDARRPFRYTCSVAPFKPGEATQTEEKLAWLSEDLAEKLSVRIGRLSFFDPREEKKLKGKLTESHIHVSGSYVIREGQRKADQQPGLVIEIMPRVRVGSLESADTLTFSVTYPWPASSEKKNMSKKDNAVIPAKKSSNLTREKYDRLFERVYFSVVSLLYQEIRKDVEHKIDLLPSSYACSVALLYEAQDYARSNTLNGYEDAGTLFFRAAKLLDASLRPWPLNWLPRRWFQLRLGLADRARRMRCFLARWFPAFGRREILCARARTGYVRMEAYRRSLAALSGRRANPIFEARRIAEETGKRLDDPRLHDVPGWKECRFDAYVAEALAIALLGDRPRARSLLQQAKGLRSEEAEKDTRYFYALGKSGAVPADRLDSLHKSVNLADRFDVALFDLAWETEIDWRRRAELEPLNTAFVVEKYDDVTKVNPANIQAWANLGYLHWLMKQPGDAGEAYENGIEYKEMVRETLVSELRFGLARICAETGAFEEAYRHCLRAIPEKRTEGVAQYKDDYTEYYFASMNRNMMDRFENYKENVLQKREKWVKKNPNGEKVSNTVIAFVWNDYGMACHNYYLRTGDPEYPTKAVAALKESVRYDKDFLLAHYNLSLISTGGDREPGKLVDKCHDAVATLAPSWVDGQLARLRRSAELILQYRSDFEQPLRRLTSETEKLGRERAKLILSLKEADKKLKLEEEAFKRNAKPGQDEANRREAIRTSRISGYVPSIGLTRRRNSLSRSLKEKDEAIQDNEGYKTKLKKDQIKMHSMTETEVENARYILGNIVPHDWLYTVPPTEAEIRPQAGREFRTQVLKDSQLRAEWRWQRELDDLHVKALIHFAEVLAADPGAGPTDAADLLKLVRDCFYPLDFDMLEQGRKLVGGQLQLKWEADFQGLVRELVKDEPSYYAALTWVPLAAGDTSRDEWIKLFERAEEAALSQKQPTVVDYIAERFKELAISSLAIGSAASADWGRVLGALQEARTVEYPRQPRVEWYRREIWLAHWARDEFDPALKELDGIASSTLAEAVKELSQVSTSPDREGRLDEWLARRQALSLRRADETGWSDVQKAVFELRRQAARSDETQRADSRHSDRVPVLWLHPDAIEPDDGFNQAYMSCMDGLRQQFCFIDEPAPRGIEPTLQNQEWRIDTELSERAYQLDLAATSVLSGTIRAPFFCPDPDSVEDRFRDQIEALPFAFNPASGVDDGVWITDDGLADSLVGRGYEIWRPHDYICRHVSTGILRILPDFVRYQTIARLLGELGRSSDDDLRSAARRLCGTSGQARTAMTQFVGMIRMLARDKVPVPGLDLPLRIFTEQSARGCGAVRIAEEIRRLLGTVWPGQRADARRIQLSDRSLQDLASHIEGQNARDPLDAPLVLPKDLAGRLVRELDREMRAETGRPTVLVLARHEERPYLARLAEAYLPRLTVVAEVSGAD